MAKAKKLPSGNWRVQVYSHTDADGKRHYESFTASTKKEAELMAAEFGVNRKREKEAALSFGKAFDLYIEVKTNVLSPSTIREMKRVRKRYFKELENVQLKEISDAMIQRTINELSAGRSPKTVHNLYGYIAAVFSMFAPTRKITVTLPHKIKPDIIVPTDEEIKAILRAAEGKSIYLPICLAAFGSLRRSEICALVMPDDLTEHGVVVRKSKVKSENGYVIKNTTKTIASYREAVLPQFVTDQLKKISGPVVNSTPDYVYKNFVHILDKAGVRHMRFHDLRHYWTSSAIAEGMPDDYVMRNGGWSTMNVPRAVYTHILKNKNKDFTSALNRKFEGMQHEMQHDSN